MFFFKYNLYWCW